LIQFPKRESPKNKSKKCDIFSAGEFRSFSDHLSPAFHHKFTIKKPPSAPRFSQKPLQKHHPATPEKIYKKTTAEPRLCRHLV